MEAVAGGLIGGAIAIVIASYVVSRAGRRNERGRLRFGAFLWMLGGICLVFALLPAASTLAGNQGQFGAKAALFVGFGIGAIYCYLEAAFVRGSFDDEGIEFSTPWTGAKREKWRDLESIELNGWCYWYTLTFKSGKKIRLSCYLNGHRPALEAALAHNKDLRVR